MNDSDIIALANLSSQNTIELPAMDKFDIQLRGIDQDPHQQQEFYLAPNPVSEFLMINSTQRILKVRIYSIFGNWIRSVLMDSDSDLENFINVADLKPGQYVLEAILTDGKTKISKFLKN